jgi:hypothetical protein
LAFCDANWKIVTPQTWLVCGLFLQLWISIDTSNLGKNTETFQNLLILLLKNINALISGIEINSEEKPEVNIELEIKNEFFPTLLTVVVDEIHELIKVDTDVFYLKAISEI